VAALQYTAATDTNRDPRLLRRAAEVTANCLQPSLTHLVATRWIEAESQSVDAHRAAGHALLDLDQTDAAAAEYDAVVTASPRGVEAELAALELELAADDNAYGARRVADRLVKAFPGSAAALRMQAFAAMRADDPASAVTAFEAALAAFDAHPPSPAPAPAPERAAAPGPPTEGDNTASTGSSPAADNSVTTARRELTEGLWRARILAGDSEAPLAAAKAASEGQGTAESRLTYALLLLAARDDAAAEAQLKMLTDNPDARPVALRLLGLIDFQDGRLNDAGVRFMELVNTGRFLDDAVYYLGLIAERHHDFERALGLYAQVQSGDDVVPALLRAAAILEAHGAAPAGEELLARLIEEEPSRAPEIVVAHARMVADAEQQPKALALLKRAELDYPDSTELPYALASMADDGGQTTDAIDILKKVAVLRPSDPAALNAYGYTLADHNLRLREARQLIERAYLAAPKSPAFLDSLGWVLFRQGHAAEALPYLDAAYSNEHDGDIAAHLGEVLWHLERREDAERIWSTALSLDADNRLLKATLQRLHPAK
jgi:tetratricopeptide (TPR) repeat protein